MKKLTTLLLAAGMVVSSFAGASAAEFKPSAQFINQYTFGSNGESQLGSVNGPVGELPNFQARTRIQLGFDYIASENLSATFLMRVQQYYGTGEFDSAWDQVLIRLAYIDWTVPNTEVSVRMGYQPVSLPAFAFGSNVVDARGSGITVNAPINENIAVSALWTRMAASNAGVGEDSAGATFDYNKSYADLFAVVADFNYDGFRVAPWVAYANIRNNETGSKVEDGETIYSYAFSSIGDFSDIGGNYKMDMWLIGASFELSMFDPFTFALDAYYSNASLDEGGKDYDADGFFVGASFAYKTEYATPALKMWYASGVDEEQENANGDDFMGAAYFAPCFGATSIMFDNYPMADSYVELANGGSATGLWGIMLDVSDISFIEKLSHQFVIAYMEGTNDLEGDAGTSLNMLGKDDSVIEVNFNSTYQIYKNLSTTLQLGWLAPNFEKETSENNYNDDIIRAAISFTYKF